jgi:hypothetical protein
LGFAGWRAGIGQSRVCYGSIAATTTIHDSRAAKIDADHQSLGENKMMSKQQMIDLDPDVVADYLKRKGWEERRVDAGKGSFWYLAAKPRGEFEVMLPTNRELGDFAIRMSEAIRTLAIVEDRSTREVYQQLTKQLRPNPAAAG